ncbi:MAG: carbonic anhydrase [Actinobacteria bacterium]|nr:carbonic anhydrase [Actinomycetota bacterium]
MTSHDPASVTKGPSTFADILEAADRYAATFGHGRLSPIPARAMAIVSCMDCRFDPLSCFDMEPGDVHIIRNAGARVSADVLRSLIMSTIKLDVSRIAVVHHTQCATHSLSSMDVAQAVLEKTGNDPAGIDFMTTYDGHHTLLSDVRDLANCPYLPRGTAVAGFVFEVETGRVKQTTDLFTVR